MEEFKGSHADFLIYEAAKIKKEREEKKLAKEAEELKALRPKPDISSKYMSARVKKGKGDASQDVQNEEDPEAETGGPSNEATDEKHKKAASSATKWDWLYKVGVDKVVAQKHAGRKQEDIEFEREQIHYTFSPNKFKQEQSEQLKSPESTHKLRIQNAKHSSSGKDAKGRASKPNTHTQFVVQKWEDDGVVNPGIEEDYPVATSGGMLPEEMKIQDKVPSSHIVDGKIYIDVTIGEGRQVRIDVSKSDDVSTFAADFAQLHGLSSAQQKNLENTLSQALANDGADLTQPQKANLSATSTVGFSKRGGPGQQTAGSATKAQAKAKK